MALHKKTPSNLHSRLATSGPSKSGLRLSLFALAAALLLNSAVVKAEDDPSKLEARERFDRALQLFNQGDNQGAIAEFHRVLEINDHPTVLFNLALVYATSGDSVESLATITRLGARVSQLNPTQQAKVKELQQSESQRIGQLLLKCDLSGGRLEVDGIDVGELSCGSKLSLNKGRHSIGVISSGFHPMRQSVLIAGGGEVSLSFSPEQLSGRLANIRLDISPIDVELSLDGAPLGKGQNIQELALAPGEHELKFERAGYRPKTERVRLGDGAERNITVKLEVDRAALSKNSGNLSLQVSETEALVWIDGSPLSYKLDSIPLPVGVHQLRIERDGFVTDEREVTLSPSKQTPIKVELVPTPAYRAEYASAARSQQVWGWSLTGVGAVITAGSVGFLVYNNGLVNNADSAYNERYNECETASTAGTPISSCPAELEILVEDLDSQQSKNIYGYIGVGVGAATLITGVILLVTGNDPNRYAPSEESNFLASVKLKPWNLASGGGAFLEGHF